MLLSGACVRSRSEWQAGRGEVHECATAAGEPDRRVVAQDHPHGILTVTAALPGGAHQRGGGGTGLDEQADPSGGVLIGRPTASLNQSGHRLVGARRERGVRLIGRRDQVDVLEAHRQPEGVGEHLNGGAASLGGAPSEFARIDPAEFGHGKPPSSPVVLAGAEASHVCAQPCDAGRGVGHRVDRGIEGRAHGVCAGNCVHHDNGRGATFRCGPKRGRRGRMTAATPEWGYAAAELHR